MSLLESIAGCLEKGDDTEVSHLTQHALDHGHSPEEILSEGLLKGMNVIGERFRKHEIFLPTVLLAARAMKSGMKILEPHFAGGDMPTIGSVVLGSAQGDHHDIGKNLVGVMLQGAGFEVIDLGIDVPAQRFVEAALEAKAPVIGISALLTTTMPCMKSVIDIVRGRGLNDRLKVVVGGAPVNQAYADEIGADAYGHDASQAVELIRRFAGQDVSAGV